MAEKILKLWKQFFPCWTNISCVFLLARLSKHEKFSNLCLWIQVKKTKNNCLTSHVRSFIKLTLSTCARYVFPWKFHQLWFLSRNFSVDSFLLFWYLLRCEYALILLRTISNPFNEQGNGSIPKINAINQSSIGFTAIYRIRSCLNAKRCCYPTTFTV